MSLILLQCILRFVTPRFVPKTRFSFFDHENVTNRRNHYIYFEVPLEVFSIFADHLSSSIHANIKGRYTWLRDGVKDLVLRDFFDSKFEKIETLRKVKKWRGQKHILNVKRRTLFHYFTLEFPNISMSFEIFNALLPPIFLDPKPSHADYCVCWRCFNLESSISVLADIGRAEVRL